MDGGLYLCVVVVCEYVRWHGRSGVKSSCRRAGATDTRNISLPRSRRAKSSRRTHIISISITFLSPPFSSNHSTHTYTHTYAPTHTGTSASAKSFCCCCGVVIASKSVGEHHQAAQGTKPKAGESEARGTYIHCASSFLLLPVFFLLPRCEE